MKRILILFVAVLSTGSLFGQSNIPLSTIMQITQPVDLANCNDTAVALGDTVRFRAHVVTDGGLSEVASGSVAGGNRPFIYMVDTTANGATDSLAGIEVGGWYRDANNSLQPVPGFTALFQGDKVEVVGVVEMFDGNVQIACLDANAVTLISSGDLAPSAFVPKSLQVGDFNDNNRVNIPASGEYWENSFVELTNVTVVQVTPFSGNRVSFDVADAQGNTLNVSDRFLAQRTPSHQTVNPNSPSTSGTGSFVPPAVGTFYTSLKGIIRHSANGCTGGTGRGYELNPFDSSHYEVGATAPSITNVLNFPLVPSSSDSVLISADISDADGTIDTVQLFWSADASLASGSFSSVNMTNTSGSTYEYYIPAQSDGSLVRYWIRAVDNDQTAVSFPATPASFSNPYVKHYSVRDNGLKIFDLQYSADGTGASAFEGQTVTVRGVVTAARRDCDLEYVYIQDPSDSLFAGIALIPNQDLSNVYRDQWLEVTGTVQETFGVTYLNVDNYDGMAMSETIQPTPIDPSDANLDKEAYEGMLVSYQNPNGKVFVARPDLGFGEYGIGTSASANDFSRVLAGRQSGTSATSSLYVSLVSDSSYATSNGTMNVPVVVTNGTMEMDAMHGILWFSFGNYKLLPRNNFDIVGLNVALDTNNCNVPTNVSLSEVESAKVMVYPNPADQNLNIALPLNAAFEARLMALDGSTLSRLSSAQGEASLNLQSLPAGIYLLQVSSESAAIYESFKVVVRH